MTSARFRVIWTPSSSLCPQNLKGFRVKEGLSCVFSRTATARKSTQPSPSLTRKPCMFFHHPHLAVILMTHSVGIYITQWNDGGNQHQRLVGSFTQPMGSSFNSKADQAPDISAARCEASPCRKTRGRLDAGELLGCRCCLRMLCTVMPKSDDYFLFDS